MRLLATVLVVTTGVAHAESSWSEYGAAQPLRRAEQLVEAACDLSVELRGAVADVAMQQRLTNPGPTALAATTELELPAGAQLVGATLQRGRGKPEAALAVDASAPFDRVTSDRVLGSDPLAIIAVPAPAGRARFRVIVQPIEPEQEVVLVTQWTAVATIRDGAIQLQLPGRGEDVTPSCRGVLHAVAGPGASIERLHVNDTEVGARGTATFELGAADLTLSAVLAFKRKEPVVWTQTQALGDRARGQLVTVVAPPGPPITARRALLVIDGSRSMELVGRHNVKRIVETIARALPVHTELDAIVFDRTATRVLGAWQPVSPERVASITDAIGKRAAGNGSDLAAAFALARSALSGTSGSSLVIAITDGVLGDVSSAALVAALGGSAKELDLHAVSLAPGLMGAPDTEALRQTVEHYGGSEVEVPLGELDLWLADVGHFLQPAWLELDLVGSNAVIPRQLRAGTGVVLTSFVPGRPTLRGRGTEARVSIRASTAPAAPIAQLVLASPPADGIASKMLAKLRARHPVVDSERSFVVLSSAGKVAASRRAMIAGGGPYTRLVDVDDPRFPADPLASITLGGRGGSAIDADTIKLLFRTQLQPAAFACYQRALTKTTKLAGTTTFHLELGRGELTRAEVKGLGDATFDACLVDAAYKVTPPLPNPAYNTDDRSLVTYPLTFTIREDKPFVLAGDADSSTPLDIDKIEGGVPGRKRIKAVDTTTPLGNLRPPPSP